MKSKPTDLREIKNNPNNPRVIRDEKFGKLVRSLKEFPEMIDARPLIVNEDMEVLGGNMRLKAMIEAGWKKAPVVKVDWPIEKQREFIIKDNLGYGEWDWDAIANDWNAGLLNSWGFDVWDPEDIDMDEFFQEHEEEEKSSTKIVLDYSEEEYAEVLEAFNSRDGSKEQIVYKLLGL